MTKNNRGPKTEPWGTPFVTDTYGIYDQGCKDKEILTKEKLPTNVPDPEVVFGWYHWTAWWVESALHRFSTTIQPLITLSGLNSSGPDLDWRGRGESGGNVSSWTTADQPDCRTCLRLQLTKYIKAYPVIFLQRVNVIATLFISLADSGITSRCYKQASRVAATLLLGVVDVSLTAS
ncbi:hypothetical protein J6590_036345 [Homalodisca vitripennis]|nr:hypothetical protein J6590_036345 [Homalodisca vitripennis]